MDEKSAQPTPDTKAIQARVFEIMCSVDSFCRENGIRYMLSGGTCLGAVRHKGFIPWDDDADLMMPRPDYERFIELYSRDTDRKYELVSVKTSPDWPRPHSCVYDPNSRIKQRNVNDMAIGIYVDIFPVDGMPVKPLEFAAYYKRMKVLDVLRNVCRRTEYDEGESYKLIKGVLKGVLRGVKPHVYAEKLDRFAKKYSYEEAKQVGASLALHYWEKETIDKACMDQTVEMPFEGKLFPVPVGYHTYLSNLYGDYMTMPKNAAELGHSHQNRESVDLNL